MRPSRTREAGKEAPPHHRKGSGLWRVLLQVQGDTAWGAGAHPAWEEGVSLLDSWASKNSPARGRERFSARAQSFLGLRTEVFGFAVAFETVER